MGIAPASDILNLTITPAPVAVAPSDTEICSDQNAFTITGASSANGAVSWTSSGDGSFNDATIDNPIYTFGANDLLGGGETLTMTVAGNGSCVNAVAAFNLSITPAPIAVAPSDTEICSDQNALPLRGASSANGAVSWSSSGDGSFNDATIDNPIYTFGANDLLGGGETLTMTVAGNGSCVDAVAAVNLYYPGT